MTVIYVITWRYSDGSGSGAVSGHQTAAGAEAMVRILNAHADTMKTYKIEPIPFEGATP